MRGDRMPHITIGDTGAQGQEQGAHLAVRHVSTVSTFGRKAMRFLALGCDDQRGIAAPSA
jgi:hypothetical protein